jgi:TonB family protein
MADKLEFDERGHLRGASEVGPLTLNGIDVTGLSLRGKDLLIRGERVALIADVDGRLKRKAVHSTTILFGSLRRPPNNTFVANEEMTLIVHPDSAGGFDVAVETIFANGLADLSPSVPPYWRCYAEGFFGGELSMAEAKKAVSACVERRSLSHADPEHGVLEGFSPPKIVATVPPRYNATAGELHVEGLCEVHFTVTDHGVPVGFQIVQALGAGLDEETLRAVSAFTFEPARRGPKRVPADLDFPLTYELKRQP